MTIYLVEDDTIYADFIRKSLAKNSTYSITWFPSAEDCLETVTKNGIPDALVLDYKLPGMAGIELYEKLQDQLPDEYKCIIMSSIDDGNLVLSFIKRGVRDYVIKDDNVIESLVAILEGKEDDQYLFN